jgi:hypothetical protein
LRRKYASKTNPSPVKLHKLCFGAKLKKNINPDVFITYLLKDLRSRMEDMKSAMTDNQFILHVISNLMECYINQVGSLEKWIWYN